MVKRKGGPLPLLVVTQIHVRMTGEAFHGDRDGGVYGELDAMAYDVHGATRQNQS